MLSAITSSSTAGRVDCRPMGWSVATIATDAGKGRPAPPHPQPRATHHVLHVQVRHRNHQRSVGLDLGLRPETPQHNKGNPSTATATSTSPAAMTRPRKSSAASEESTVTTGGEQVRPDPYQCRQPGEHQQPANPRPSRSSAACTTTWPRSFCWVRRGPESELSRDECRLSRIADLWPTGPVSSTASSRTNGASSPHKQSASSLQARSSKLAAEHGGNASSCR
jgi:hypothetical protein